MSITAMIYDKFYVCIYIYSSTYTKIGTIQRRLAWPLRKDDTQIHEAFQIFQTVPSRDAWSMAVMLW